MKKFLVMTWPERGKISDKLLEIPEGQLIRILQLPFIMEIAYENPPEGYEFFNFGGFGSAAIFIFKRIKAD